MRKEFGKYVLDISKYTVTSVLIAALFKDGSAISIYVGAGLFAALLLIAGLVLMREEKVEEVLNRTKKRR